MPIFEPFVGFYESYKIIAQCRDPKTPLTFDDLYALPHDTESRTLMREHGYQLLEEAAQKRQIGQRLNLFRRVLHIVRWEYFVISVVAVIRTGAVFLQIYALSMILDFFPNDSAAVQTKTRSYDDWVEYAFPVMMATGSFLQSLCQHNMFHNSNRNALRARAMLSGMIFCKATRQKPKHSKSITTGQQMNLMASDTFIVVEWLMFFIFLFSAQFETLCALMWIAFELRWASAATFGAVALLLPLQMYVGRIVGQYRTQSFKQADKRVKAATEFFNGIGVVKMNAWEKSICSVVNGLRALEGTILRNGTQAKLFNLSFFFVVPGLLSLVTFGVLITYDTTMDTRKTFVVLALVQTIARAFTFIPRCVTATASALTSLRRIEDYLALDFDDEESEGNEGVFSDTKEDAQAADAVQKQEGNLVLRGDFGWGSPEDCGAAEQQKAGAAQQAKDFVLRNVDVDVPRGSLTVIIGSVGSGKSTLIQALLGNCRVFGDALGAAPPKSGSVNNSSGVTTAYVSQEVWIMDGTVRDNILFGHPLELEWYKRVLVCCALAPDLDQWGGDCVEVGEKGITLSGGQKQRISLARACYSRADVLLLDDPISAVDSNVAEFLMSECIRGLLSTKTVVLVTHHPKPLQFADHFVVLRGGEQVARCASLEDIPPEFAGMLSSHSQRGTPGSARSADSADSAASPLRLAGSAGGTTAASPSQLMSGHSLRHKLEASKSLDLERLLGSQRAVVKDEGVFIGSVNRRVYTEYVRAGGVGLGLACFATLLIAQACRNVGEWWFARWTSRAYPSLEAWEYLAIEAALVVTSGVLAVIRALLYGKYTTSASSSLHDAMFSAVLYSPMTFFESVPLGRIINRFTKDVDYADDMLPRASFDFLQMFGIALGALVVVAATIPWFIIAIVVFGVVFYFLVSFYLPASRQLRRLEGISRSPTNQIFQSALSGLSTIRAYDKMLGTFTSNFFATVDLTSKTFLNIDRCQRWVGIRMDWISTCAVLVVGVLCVALQDHLSRSLAGLAIAQSLMLTGMLQFSLRCAAETESLMTAVERIQEYSVLPAQKNAGTKELHANDDAAAGAEGAQPDRVAVAAKRELGAWPSEGVIEVRGLTVCYDSYPDKQVLSDVNFSVRAGEKVAIVGRTGAGKSTLLSAFFRLVEIPDGSITIDGVPTTDLDLFFLRSRLGVIPQTPTLFGESLRYNLDPFGEFEDEDLYGVLRRVQLLDALAAFNPAAAVANEHGAAEEGNEPFGGRACALVDLQMRVSEGGSNFSVGQRQLLCVARALLREPKVLLLDEATANVDHATDALIQQMIRSECYNTTVITIAHRLNTIMDYDKVVVLGMGKVLECGSVDTLMKQKGVFFEMVEAMQHT